MNNNWRGIMTILTFQHWRDGQLLEERKNIRNILHSAGEQFILKVCFGGLVVPSAYWLGLDNRNVPAIGDTLASLVGEPTGNGYLRQSVIPQTNFVITPSGQTYVATSSIVTFSASGSSWGPVQNLFLSTTLDNSGVLVSTAPLTPAFSVNAGDQVLLQLGMSLGNPA
jgi:hypothetical protein